jgi:nucleotide-binding universal stress UspA family protein
MKILIAVDGSLHTQRMLTYLTAHPELVGSQKEFTVITVVPPIAAHLREVVAADVLDRQQQRLVKDVLDPVSAFASRSGWNLTAMSKVGHVADTLIETAGSGDFDLLVMGSHGNSALASLMLGSVVSGVLSRSKVPLLIVR